MVRTEMCVTTYCGEGHGELTTHNRKAAFWSMQFFPEAVKEQPFERRESY